MVIGEVEAQKFKAAAASCKENYAHENSRDSLVKECSKNRRALDTEERRKTPKSGSNVQGHQWREALRVEKCGSQSREEEGRRSRQCKYVVGGRRWDPA